VFYCRIKYRYEFGVYELKYECASTSMNYSRSFFICRKTCVANQHLERLVLGTIEK